MTSPNGAVPEGAYVSGGSGQSGLSDLNTLTEGVAKQRMQGALAPSFNRHRDGVWAFTGSLIEMVNGRYEGEIPEFIDGQLELNERLGLLGATGYCNAFMPRDLRVQVTGPTTQDRPYRALPFTQQLGPNNDAELVTVTRQHPNSGNTNPFREEACIRLDRPGLWHVNALVHHEGSGGPDTYCEIVVLNPDLTPYSYTIQESSYTRGNAARVNPLFKPVVVPTAGYYVQARFHYGPYNNYGVRDFYGGAARSSFSVTQWSDDVANPGTDEPTGQDAIVVGD